MDHIALLERPPEEVSAVALPPRRPGRFTGVAVLAAIAAAVLGISALGSAAPTTTGAAQLAASAAAAQAAAPAGAPAGAQPGAPAAHNAAGQTAAPGGAAPAAAPPGAGNLTIQMVSLKFQPQALGVAIGDTVTWVNNDTASHTVTVTDGPEKFDSGLLTPGKSFSHQFTKPGVYSYYCAVHPDMTGTVTVAAAGTAVPAPPGAATPPPGDAMAPPAGGSAGCAPSAAFDALWMHLKAAHLQESPSQQAADLLALDQYVKTHTVLVQNMLAPLLDGAVTGGSAKSFDALWMHLKAAHLQESPSQQAADLLALDQYVKTHTVLAQNMLDPQVSYTAC